MRLALFDLDNTLLAGDSDYEWGQFLVDRGILDREAYEAQNRAYYEQYMAGTLDIHEYLGFALRPLAEHTPQDLARWHLEFMRTRIVPMIAAGARALVGTHLAAGDVCAIVTSTNSCVTAPIARQFAIPYLIARAAARHDFPVNVLFWGNVDAGTALIDRHPDTRFIIDHLGILQPRVPPAPPQPWADLPKVLELAKRPNAVIKVSGACTLSREPYPFPDIWDPLARVFDAWGFERCLWGTDWTRAYAVVNYEQAVEPFLETGRLSDSERAMLMGGACAKAYGWSPRKG